MNRRMTSVMKQLDKPNTKRLSRCQQMQIGLPLPCFESEGLEDGNCQYHESGTDESDADGFFVTFVHTAAKVQILSEK